MELPVFCNTAPMKNKKTIGLFYYSKGNKIGREELIISVIVVLIAFFLFRNFCGLGSF